MILGFQGFDLEPWCCMILVFQGFDLEPWGAAYHAAVRTAGIQYTGDINATPRARVCAHHRRCGPILGAAFPCGGRPRDEDGVAAQGVLYLYHSFPRGAVTLRFCTGVGLWCSFVVGLWCFFVVVPLCLCLWCAFVVAFAGFPLWLPVVFLCSCLWCFFVVVPL